MDVYYFQGNVVPDLHGDIEHMTVRAKAKENSTSDSSSFGGK